MPKLTIKTALPEPQPPPSPPPPLGIVGAPIGLCKEVDTPDIRLITGSAPLIHTIPRMIDFPPPRPLYKTNPKYPNKAIQAGIEGTVILQVMIDTDGNVVETLPIYGHPLLAASAIKAVKNWIFEPFTAMGEPKKYRFTIEVPFKLK